MLEKILNNRTFVLYLLPFFLGLLSVFSFQPFNFSFINFFLLPVLFFILVYVKKKSKSTYRKKPYLRNLFFVGTLFGFGFYLSGIFWVAYSLTFDESFKISFPLKKTSPALASAKRKIVRPSVVFPQPDSPTKPKVSPG